MNKEIVKEQIIRSLEDILDQTHIIFENEGKIPQIEVDIIMANIRKLYEQYVNLNKFNVILSEPILSPTSRAYSARRAHDRQLPKNEFKDPSKNQPKPVVIPEAKVESVTPVNPEETAKRNEEPDTTTGKKPLLRFESYVEPVVEPTQEEPSIEMQEEVKTETEPITEFRMVLDEPVEENPVAAETSAIEEPQTEEPILMETPVSTIVEEEAQPINEETLDIDAIINEIIAETKEEPIVEAPSITPEPEVEPVAAEAEPMVETTPEIEIPTVENNDTPSAENEAPAAPEVPSLFPEFTEPKQEPVKRKRPKSPLDLFADSTSSSLADKFKEEGTSSLNDKLSEKKEDKSLASKLQNQQITDLKKGVGINEKFLFINELFDGNMAEYNLAIDHINTHCTNLEEAETYIVFLKQNYNWDESRMSVTLFRNLMERRFPRQA